MIYGIGIDIVYIPRIKRMWQRWQERFLRRIFTKIEVTYSMRKKSFYYELAARIAAKEAFAKALGTGIGRVVSFQDLTVRNNENGKPHFIPSEKLRHFLVEKKIKRAHLSISDESRNAIAFVVLETFDVSAQD